MARNEQPESRTRWLLRYLVLGVGASAGAVGIALIVDLAFDPSWSWSRIAIILLGASAALLIVATTSAGSGMPVAMSYDRFAAYIEADGKQMAGTPMYEPAKSGLDALLAILPPFLTAVVLLVIYGF
jgi:hypothetical protein